MNVTKIIAGLLTVPMILSLAACGDEEDDDDTERRSRKKKSSSSVTESVDEPGENSSSLENVTTAVQTTAEPTTEAPTEPQVLDFWSEYGYGSEAYISRADAFHDGMAWVELSGGDKGMIYAINTEGEVKFTIDPDDIESKWGGWVSYNYHTYFNQGVAIVSTDTKQQLINTEGEVVWDAAKEGMDYAVERWGEQGILGIVIGNQNDGNTMSQEEALGDVSTNKEKAFSGYALVQFDVDTFDYTGKAFGILAPDGSWQLEPFETDRYNVEYSPEWAYLYYNNDGDDYNTSYTYVNIETGETVLGNSYPLPDQVKVWQRVYNCKNQDGLDFDTDKKAFVDASGNVVIDCSQYTFTAEKYGKFDISNSNYIPAFHDGYAVLAVYNEDKAPYYFAIDKEGNRQFEPKRFADNFTFDESMSFYISEDVLTCGCFTLGPQYWYTEGWHADEEGYIRYFDHTGKEPEALKDLDLAFLGPFSDGIAAVTLYTDSSKTTERMCYIDHDGNELFPKH